MRSWKATKKLKRIGVGVILISVVVIFVGISKRNDLRSYRQTVFVESAFRGNVSRMRILLALGANVDEPACRNFLCPPPIVAAAFDEHSEGVELLLDRGANVNSKMERGQTALMVAAYYGHANTVRLLLSRGADINAQFDGDTALTWAKQKGHTEIVDLLAKAGAVR